MRIARNLILSLLAVSLFWFLAGCQPVAMTEPTNSGDASGDNSTLDMLEVIYFHRPQRCSGCVYAETGTRYTLENYFADELANGNIVFKTINLGDELNATIVEHYGAYTSSLFINNIKGGVEHIDEVTEVWFLLNKDSEFVSLVKSKIDYYLSGEQP
ncbi:nitrophenyl compound nitroreductase subunit ArsF family protein [Chloroflexota bacterium]